MFVVSLHGLHFSNEIFNPARQDAVPLPSQEPSGKSGAVTANPDQDCFEFQ
jgi:hypothetical protein